MHPFASSIDSPELKEPAEIVEFSIFTSSTVDLTNLQIVLMRGSCPSYVRLPEGRRQVFEEYPVGAFESLEDWHKKNGEYVF